MKRNAVSSGSAKNAFSVLMDSGKKKRKLASATKPSRYVLCPCCGKHVADMEINTHLDACMKRNTNTPTHIEERPNNQDTLLPTPLHEESKQKLSKAKESKQKSVISPDEKDHEDEPSQSANKSIPTVGGHNMEKQIPSNAFTLMMKRSSEVFSHKEPSKLFQRFHLGTDGCATLRCYSAKPDDSYTPSETIEWTSTLQVKDRTAIPDTTGQKQYQQQQQQQQPVVIELVVSSSVPSTSSDNNKRLVQRHSRLSVPVLKSILQKSIRRRRPLPAVRVAMELADKSMGDLLRRLPIIIFEDSSLHYDLPFLMWVMVAHTKGFGLPTSLVQKVLRMVFEMASCPFQDHLEDCEVDEEEETDNNDDHKDQDFSSSGVVSSSLPSLGSFHQLGIDVRPGICDTIIWSTLLRIPYGGMACDMKMLRLYANGWKRRFAKGEVQTEIATRLPQPSLQDCSIPVVYQWLDVPTRIHASGRKQSESRVADLCRTGLAKLEAKDLAIEGVDFHCSPIVDIMLKDQGLVRACLEWLDNNEAKLRGSLSPKPPPPPLSVLHGSDDGVDGRQRSWLEGIIKKCMWRYSAGVNHRRSLSDPVGSVKQPDDHLKCLWDELLSPRSHAYAELYIQQKLAR